MLKITFIKNNAKSVLLLTFFSGLLCKWSPNRRCRSLCNSEYRNSKVIIMTFYLGMTLLEIIYQYFLKSYFRYILYVFSGLGFRFARHEVFLLIQCGRFHNYLFSCLARLVEYHLFG